MPVCAQGYFIPIRRPRSHAVIPLCHTMATALRHRRFIRSIEPPVAGSIPRTNANLLLGRRNIVMAFGVLSWVMGMWQGGLSSLQGSGN